MSNKGNNFLRQLNSRTNSKILYQNSLKTKEKQDVNRKNIYVVNIEKNPDYIIMGKEKEFIPKEKIIVKTSKKIVTVEKDNQIKRFKTSKEQIETINKKITDKIPFEEKLVDDNEEKIKKQLQKIINKDKKKITKINEEIDKIKEETHKYKLSEDIEELNKKIIKIKETLKDIKNHYTIISEYYDFKGYETFKNEILLNSIEDYYFYQEESQIEEFIRNCKNEGKKLNNVIETYEKCLKSEEKVLEIKNYTQKRDNDYKEHNNKVVLVEQSYKKIIENFNIEDDFIKSLNTDLYYLEQKIENEQIFTKSKSLFNNLFNIGMCTTLMPILPNLKMLIQLILLKNSIEATHHFFNPQIEKTFTNTVLNEYLNLIFDKEKLIIETEKMLTSTIKNVKQLKNEYINRFSEYSNIFKEYSLYLKKLEQMEMELEKKQKQIIEAKKELEKNKEKAKVLKKD